MARPAACKDRQENQPSETMTVNPVPDFPTLQIDSVHGLVWSSEQGHSRATATLVVEMTEYVT